MTGILILLIVSYSLQVYCDTNQTNETDCPIDALPAPVNLTLNNYTNSSVVLSWVPTIASSDNHCIKEYRIVIVSNISNYSMAINQTQITLEVPSNNLLSTQYCAMITTVSISNIIGNYSEPPICSTWDVPAPLSISYNMSDGNLIWKSKQGDRPPITDYYINLLDFSQQVIQSGNLPLNPTMVNLSQSMFSVIIMNITTIEIIAANVLGNNTGTRVNITQPSSSSTATTNMMSLSTTATVISSFSTKKSSHSISSSEIEITTSTANSESSTGMKTMSTPRGSLARTITSTTMKHSSSNTRLLTPQSSSSSAISTSIPSVVTSSSSIVPVIGGAVGGVVLLAIIIVVLVVIFSVIVTMKKKSKAYAIKTLEDEAVKIDNVNMYKEVGEHASNNRNKGNGSATQSELPPSIPMRNVSLGAHATVDGSTANTHIETTQQKETSTVELPTYQDPKSIRREVATSTGSIYTVHQKKTRSTGGQRSTVSVPDRVDYADLSLQARTTASRSQLNANHPNDDYDDILSVSSNAPDRVDYADLSFQANDTASRQPNTSPQPQSNEDYDDISSVNPPLNVPANYADLSFNSSRPNQQPRPGNIEPVQYAEIHK